MNSVHSIAVVMIVLCLGFPGCEDQGERSVDSPVPGTLPTAYSYKAYTPAGILAVVGSLTMAKTDSTTITGTWASESVSPGVQVGPQVGSGILAGELRDSKITLDLNPGWRDNNVVLAGTIQSDKIVGTWSWITFAGPTSNGTFEAVKKK